MKRVTGIWRPRPTMATTGFLLSLSLGFLLSIGCNTGGRTGSSSSTSKVDGPEIVSVEYSDFNGDGDVNEGDFVVVLFDDNVLVHSSKSAGFSFRNAAHTFGQDATLTQSVPGSARVEIELGQNADFDLSSVQVNIDEEADIPITDVDNTSAQVSAASTNATITDVTSVAPTLLTANYTDADLDDVVNIGDIILCEFDQPIVLPAGSVAASDFFDPAVGGNTYGVGATITAFSSDSSNRGVLITLGTGPALTVTGTYTMAGSAAGVTAMGNNGDPNIRLQDFEGNDATDGTTVDLGFAASSKYSSGQDAKIFLGATDENRPDTSASTLSAPAGSSHFEGSVSVGGMSFTVDLFLIADTANHRVLVFEGRPAGNNTNADAVLGQLDFSTGLANQSEDDDATAGPGTLSSPADAHFDESENAIFVSDTGNNRVLVFQDVIDSNGDLNLTNGQFADVVLGQSNFAANEANEGSSFPTSRSLSAPAGLHLDDGQLIVADSGNHRALLWSSIPSSNNVNASVVLGQSSFTVNTENQGSISGATMSSPSDVFLDADFQINGNTGCVIVADSGNHRVLVFETSSPATGATADSVIGQANATAQATATTAAGLSNPTGVYAVEGAAHYIYVADQDNHRVMNYSFDGTTPGDLSAFAEAGTAVGQADETSGSSNRGAAAANNSFSAPARVCSSESSTPVDLFVVDTQNHRVLNFESLPTTNAATADLVQGQGTFTDSDAKGHQFNFPGGVVLTAGSMIVADRENHRVLIYSTVPTAATATPDIAIGQVDLVDSQANRGGTASASTMNTPSAVATDGTNLAVADTENNRVLIYTTIPAASNAAANIVLGQADAVTVTENTGGVSAASMNAPMGVWISGSDLWVADTGNHRILRFSSFAAASTGDLADRVIGHDDFTSDDLNNGDVVNSDTLSSPEGLMISDGVLYVADTGNNRVLGFLALPAQDGAGADFVLGQVDFSTASSNNGLFSMNDPVAIATDGTRMAVVDRGNHRVLLFSSLPSSRTAAFRVLGQIGSSTGSANQGGQPDADTLYSPQGVFMNGSDIWVSDSLNSRLNRFR